MNLKIVVAVGLGGLGLAALYQTQRPAADPAVRADNRIVQAPADTPPVKAAVAATGRQSGAGASAGAAPMAPRGAGTPVGFTLYGGRLYLVTAKTKAATALSATVTKAGTPTFQCRKPVDKVALFSAWELRSQGGSGALPALSRDGQLLAALPGADHLSCSLAKMKGG